MLLNSFLTDFWGKSAGNSLTVQEITLSSPGPRSRTTILVLNTLTTSRGLAQLHGRIPSGKYDHYGNRRFFQNGSLSIGEIRQCSVTAYLPYLQWSSHAYYWARSMTLYLLLLDIYGILMYLIIVFVVLYFVFWIIIICYWWVVHFRIR